MPATDSSAVQITINVVDGATGETISKVTKSLDSLGEAGARNGKQVASGMRDIGHAGEAAGAGVAAGMKQVGEHTLSSLDNVRLLRDDLGIRLPRAMEKAIAQSGVLSSVIGSVGGALVGLGALEIGARVGQQLYGLYEKFVDVNGQVDAFKKKLGEAAEQKFFDSASIEDVNANLQKTNALISAIESKRQASIGISGVIGEGLKGFAIGGFGGAVSAVGRAAGLQYSGPGDAAAEGKAISQSDQDRENLQKRAHEGALREIHDNKERASAMGEAAAKQAALNAKVAEAGENRRYANQQTHERNQIVMRGKGIFDPSDPRYLHDNPNSGREQYNAEVNSAQIEFGANQTKEGLVHQKEASHATAEARMSGLEGEPLALAQRDEQVRVLTERAKEVGMAQNTYFELRDAIYLKAREEQKKRQQAEGEQTAQLDAEAGLAGLTGLAKEDQERAVKLAALDREKGKFSKADTYSRRASDINGQSAAGETKSQGDFTDRLSQLDAGRADRYASESDRITESARKTTAEITKAWTEMYGQLGPLDQRRVQGQQALNDEIGKIQADAARQRQEAGQRVEDDTRKLEDQAGRESLPKYQQQTAAIVDEFNERMARLEELRARDAANADRYRRQEIAEEQIKNGKLIEQRRALEEQLAGKLRGLIGSHPLDFLKSQGEEQADKFASQALFKFFPQFSTAVAGGGKRGSGDGPFGLPNIFGSGFGGKHPAKVDAGEASAPGSGTHNDNPSAGSLAPGVAPGPTPSAARIDHATSSSTVTATTATINVQSATINGVGNNTLAGSGGRAGSGGTYAATGNGGSFDIGSSVPGLTSGSPWSPSPWTEAGANSSAPGVTANAPWTDPGSTTPGSVPTVPTGITDEAGASSDTTAKIEAGVSGAATRASEADPDGIGGQIGGLASAGLGVFAAADGKGGFGGAVSGAVAGEKLGAILGGPIGAGIGAIGGAVLGLFGFGARAKAEKYNNREVKPRIANDLIAFEGGQADYQSMFDDLTHLVTEAKIQTRQMGPGAAHYYNSTIDPEIKAAQSRMTTEQKAGRSRVGMSAAQLHSGGRLRDFGSMATSDHEGWVHGKRDEFMLNQQAAMSHADAAMMMNAGASRSDMARFYGGDGGGTRPAESSGGTTHLHFHAPDAKGMYQLFMDNKHHIRSAVNASTEENSGGSDYA